MTLMPCRRAARSYRRSFSRERPLRANDSVRALTSSPTRDNARSLLPAVDIAYGPPRPEVLVGPNSRAPRIALDFHQGMTMRPARTFSLRTGGVAKNPRHRPVLPAQRRIPD